MMCVVLFIDTYYILCTNIYNFFDEILMPVQIKTIRRIASADGLKFVQYLCQTNKNLKMRFIKLFLTTLAVMLATVAYAQELTITGNVIDGSTGEPVPFASVHVKGTMTGTNTDIDGAYAITASADGVLVFSSIGYMAVEVPVAGKAQINCELPVDSEMLENAVVVGYGSAKKVGTIVGSVTTVNSDAIKTAPSSSALDQLQGQVAGLSVMTTGGVAGDNNVSMQLHGMGSLG